MKFLTLLFFCALFTGSVQAQVVLSSYNQNETLTSDQCYDIIKVVWDGLKKISEEFTSQITAKSEFESTAEYIARVQREKEQYAAKISKFATDNKLNSRNFFVWMKADLIKYNADNQTYSIKSPTQILIQPKKPEIAIICPNNKYIKIFEKDLNGYRRANIQLNTEPEFTWFVNRQTAQATKNKESQIFFRVSFNLSVSISGAENQIILQYVPTKIALMDQGENFTYWSEDIH